MKYNYVFYGISNSYMRHSHADVAGLENVRLYDTFYSGDNILAKKLFKAHTYAEFNRFFKLPFKGIWTSHCFNFNFQNNRPICFIMGARYFNQDYFFEIMKKKYSECRFVMVLRDLVDNYKKWYPEFDIDEIQRKFDLVMSYDKNECMKYNMIYFRLEASKEDIKMADDYPWSDVVFIGRAKGRLNKIIRAYDILTDAGLKCFFYIVGAKEKQKYKDIIFAKKMMSYDEMLAQTINSKCILELSQEGEYGFTSRSQEAIMYNKKLITDSLIVKDQRFYPSENILFINNVEDIRPEFIKKEKMVDYGYSNDYSPIRLLEQIDILLK